MAAQDRRDTQPLMTGWTSFCKALTELPFSEAALARQSRNLQVFYRANLVALEGTQAFVNRHFEIARESAGAFSSLFQSLFAPNGSADDKLAKQAQYSTQVLEKSLASIKELGEIVGTVQSETLSVINQHVMNGLDEMRDYLDAGVARTGAAAE